MCIRDRFKLGQNRPAADTQGVFDALCQTREIVLSTGDRLHLKANRKLTTGDRVTNGELVAVKSVPVSYTHLDVYKRQMVCQARKDRAQSV